MKIYGMVGTYEMLVDQSGSGCPDGFIEMKYQRPSDVENTLDYTAQPDGTWEITKSTIESKLAAIENEWRVSELLVISRQLEAIEEYDADEIPADLLSGTRKQWLGYRGKVTAWVLGIPGYPYETNRPKRP